MDERRLPSGEWHIYDWVLICFDQEAGLNWREICATPPVLPQDD